MSAGDGRRAELLNIGVLGAWCRAEMGCDVRLAVVLVAWLLCRSSAVLVCWEMSGSRTPVWIMATASPSILQIVIMPFLQVFSRFSVISAMVRGRLTFRRSMSAILSAGVHWSIQTFTSRSNVSVVAMSMMVSES